MKITKKDQIQNVRDQIAGHDDHCIGAMVKIYEYQTAQEQNAKVTIVENGVGFSGCDAEILTSFVHQFQRNGSLSPRQMDLARRKMVKYARQLIAAGGYSPATIKDWKGKDPVAAKPQEAKGKLVSILTENVSVKVEFPYSPALKDQVKALPRPSGKPFFKEPSGCYWTASLTIANLIRLKELGFSLDRTTAEWLKAGDAPIAPVGEISGLGGILRDFQRTGVEWLEGKRGRGIIGDDMGLGKTVQALAWIQNHPEARPVIIACPSAVKLNWEREAKKWLSDGTKIEVLSGTKPYSTDAEILIINYDILGRGAEEGKPGKGWIDTLKGMGAKIVVMDEIHYIKSRGAQRTKACQSLCRGVPHVIGLTGTLLVNRPQEAFNALNLIDPETFGSFWKYAQRYCGATNNGYGWDFSGSSNTRELHELLTRTAMIRRTKDEVLTELPPLTRTVVPMEIVNRKEYQRAERDFIKWMQDEGVAKEKIDAAKRAKVLTQIEQLKQLVVNGKWKASVDWIENFLSGGEKLVVFTMHQKVVDALMKKFGNVAVQIDGRVTGAARQQAIDAFNEDPSKVLMVANLKAGGIGINLQFSCNNTATVELGWGPGDHDQADARVHRMGQQADSVNAYYLIAPNTIEERISELIDEKRKVIEAVLDGNEVEEAKLLTALLGSMMEENEKRAA